MKKIKLLLLIVVCLLFLLPGAMSHDVPFSKLETRVDGNAISFNVIPPVYCIRNFCSEPADYNYNYGIDNFLDNLTIINKGNKCKLNPASFSKNFNKTTCLDSYHVEYVCSSYIESINITNTLFYELFGYYFEQYYVLNCSNDTRLVYTDLIEASIILNYSKICEINKSISVSTNEGEDGYINSESAYEKNDFVNIQENKITEPEKVKTQSLWTSSYLYNKIIEYSKSEKMFIFVVIFSVIFGILHSFTPGHGKTLIISYLVGSNPKIKDIFLLAITTAVTHVSDILILSIVFLVVPVSLKNKYFDSITLVAALLIILFGIKILIDNIWKKHDEHHHHHHDALVHNHEHSHGSHIHHHEHHDSKKKIMTLGFLAGLAPCPTAWALFSVLIALKLYYYAFISVLSFSIGLVLTLLVMSLIFVKAKRLLKFIPLEIKGYPLLRILSGALITLTGILMLFGIL